jgi:hypothetical protein
MYIGNTPVTQLYNSALDTYNGDAATVAFTLSRIVGTEKDLDVTVNGVPQDPNTSYTVNGITLTFTEAPSAGTGNIIVRYRAYVVTKIVPDDESVTASMIANTSITGVKIATGTITGDKIAVGTLTGNLFLGGTITGDKITANTIGSSNLTITGVTAGIYGGTGNTVNITIDAQGRVTAAANVVSTGGTGVAGAKTIILANIFHG